MSEKKAEYNTQYKAVLYKSAKNNVYIANCYAMNIAGYGRTEEIALENLEKSISEICGKKHVEICVLPALKVCGC